MRKALQLCSICILALGAPACAELPEHTFPLVSHCDLYESPNSLSEILNGADVAFLARQSTAQVPLLGPAQFEVAKTYFGSVPQSTAIMRASASSEDEVSKYISQRYAGHVSPAFFWTGASRPSAYGYSGLNNIDCNLVPVSQPGQQYIIAFEDGRTTLFEPVPDGPDPLKDWVEYYSESVFPYR